MALNSVSTPAKMEKYKMNPTENQLEAQMSEKQSKSILTVRNLVIAGGTVLLLTIGAGTFAYIQCMKSSNIATGNAQNTTAIPSVDQTATAVLDADADADAPLNASESVNSTPYTPPKIHDASELIGKTELIYAITKKDSKYALYLIDKGADIEEQDDYKNNAFYHAIVNGLEDVVDRLIGMDVDVNQVFVYGTTPLMVAIRSEYFEIAQALIKKGAELDFISTGGLSAMCYAIESVNIEFLNLLISKGASFHINKNYYQSSIATLAKHEKIEMIELLIEKFGFDLNERDLYYEEANRTVLHYAVENNDLEMVQYLIDKGVMDLDLADKDKKTPLHVSIGKSNFEITKLLIESGAIVNGADEEKLRLKRWICLIPKNNNHDQ